MRRIQVISGILYAVTAFSAALVMHSCSDHPAYAAEQAGSELTVLAVNDRVNQLSDRISTMYGIGTGGFMVLGLLQTLNLIVKPKERKES